MRINSLDRPCSTCFVTAGHGPRFPGREKVMTKHSRGGGEMEVGSNLNRGGIQYCKTELEDSHSVYKGSYCNVSWIQATAPSRAFPPAPTSESPTTQTMAYCDRCDRWFPHDRAYEQHTENSQSHWICADCDIDFATQKSLDQHYANSPKHSYCQECDQHFSGKGARAQHMRAKHWYCETHDRVWQ